MNDPLPRPRRLQRRPLDEAAVAAHVSGGLPAPLARLAAARKLAPEAVRPCASTLPSPQTLPDIGPAVMRICDAIQNGETLVGCFDHDVDGVTSGAVLWLALTGSFGVDPARLHVLTSHKLTEGYGLSDPVVERILALAPAPTLCITADQGSADEPRIARLHRAGIQTVVTDHHAIPASGIPPSALATVNPGRADSRFPDPAIAGVGVMWLVMSAVRHELVRRGHIPRSTPLLRHLLDLVAVGTIADAVSLASPSNRWFVQQGLPLIAAGRRVCWQVLPEIAESALKGGLTARDIAFGIGPLINAQGRMADAREGILFLISSDRARAAALAAQLRENNQARRQTEQALVAEAMRLAQDQVAQGLAGLTLHLVNGSPAVHGIVASRLVDRYQRPVICLSPSPTQAGELTGSIRTVPAFDALAGLHALHARHPELLRSFGGHKAAAGLRIAVADLDTLRQGWHEAVQAAHLASDPPILVDGFMQQPPHWPLVQLVNSMEPFGRGFESPVFETRAQVLQVQVFQQRHVCLTLQWPGHSARVRAMWFGNADRYARLAGDGPDAGCGRLAHMAVQLAPSVFRGQARCELTIVELVAMLAADADADAKAENDDGGDDRTDAPNADTESRDAAHNPPLATA